MGLLPAEIPEIPETRSEIVPARLARKLAPLFGMPWPRGPFGTRSWVCDYNKITLSEIARGAPLPGRGQATKADGWTIVDRVAMGALPNEVPKATLNRFGPDTKAAVVLTGANRLLSPVVNAVDSAMRLLVAADGAPLPTRLRVAAWAALLLEAFRSQPALIAAAIRARTIQRELLVEWFLPLADSITDLPLTRCEVGGPRPEVAADALSRPRELELADRTVLALGVAEADEVVDRLLRQLMAVGTRRSSSHLWLSERSPGQLAVEALVPPTELVSRYVDQLGHLLHRAPAEEKLPLPLIPRSAELAELPLLGRRAVLIALVTVLRQVQFDPEQRERTRVAIVPLLTELASLATESLGPDDPLTVLVRCRAADMAVHTLRHDRRHDLTGPMIELMSHVRRCVELAEAGTMDRGAAAEAISSANVEINIVRRTNAERAMAGLPSPDELDEWLHDMWAAYERILEIAPERPKDDESHLAAGHHLHNYASFLTTHPDNEADLLAGIELFENTVIPARELYWRRTRSFLPLRQSLQIASRATTTLSQRAADLGRPEQARQWAGKGYEWISRALADETTVELLAQSSEPAAHFCLLAVPALLAAVEHGVPGAGQTELSRARELLTDAGSWALRVTNGDETSYSHYKLLVSLRRRLSSAELEFGSGGRSGRPPEQDQDQFANSSGQGPV